MRDSLRARCELFVENRDIMKTNKKIKENHPFLTSGEDVGTAAMLALSSLSEDTAVLEAEKCYQILMEEFGKGNAMQSLSHVLALGEEDARTKCGKTVALYKILKEKGCSYGKGMELAVLGSLAMLAEDMMQAAEDIREVDQFLHAHKGVGAFGVGRRAAQPVRRRKRSKRLYFD